ncbi:adenylyltransferase/cytidyltransferase family protein [Longirhabdus pacifica]|uniref:adenylyltransferase/cytidyltransferase family protein n=1 Tax=Longirhabdus pacifica TaxID=2305227 RepID=UPI001008FFCF|nr:adenylyltransferase/cytidyltransferase family protein [Longirhabdus pacifica]
MTQHKFGFILGRFQNVHIGHEYLIETALHSCEHIVVLIGSAQVEGTVRNPLPMQLRLDMLKEIYGDHPRVHIGFLNDLTNENDHSTMWGQYVLDHARSWGKYFGLPHALDTMIMGNDEERNLWFEEEQLKGIEQIVVPRDRVDISATKMRAFILDGDMKQWSSFTNKKLHAYFPILKEKLLSIQDGSIEVE